MLRTLDFIAACAARVAYETRWKGLDNSLLALVLLAYPVLLAWLPLDRLSKWQAIACSALLLPIALCYVASRKKSINELAARLPDPGDNKSSNVGLLAFLTIGLGSLFGADHSIAAALVAFVALSCLPWRSWAGIKTAP